MCGRPPSVRGAHARSASRGGGFAVGTRNGARATVAATVILLSSHEESTLRTRCCSRPGSSCSPAVAQSSFACNAAIVQSAPLPPSVRACSSRAPLARQPVEQVVPLSMAAASECVWRHCCGETAREGSARMSVARHAAAGCTPPPHRAHCARCDSDVICVGGRRPLRRVGGGPGSKAAWREAAEAVGTAARQRQGRGSGSLGGLDGRCDRSRSARATVGAACVRPGGGRRRSALRQVSLKSVGAS